MKGAARGRKVPTIRLSDVRRIVASRPALVSSLRVGRRDSSVPDQSRIRHHRRTRNGRHLDKGSVELSDPVHRLQHQLRRRDAQRGRPSWNT
jgi:hypothetical protein